MQIEFLQNLLSSIRSQNRKIVFTNGCFDILHIGHIRFLRYLEDTYSGDIIVGVNSDESIKRLKGHNRPINKLEDRIFALESIRYVSAAVSFDTNTPEELIKIIKPDVLAKGGDYKEKMIVGEEFVRSYGGIVIKDFFISGHSTSRILDLSEITSGYDMPYSD